MSLFPDDEPEARVAAVPLAERMRPVSLAEVVGSPSVAGPGGLLERALAAPTLPSLIFWGPPGSGKTTMARLVASASGSIFRSFSAVTSGKADVTAAVKAARAARRDGKHTVLFVDEIHRFNKAQQDAFLPFVEDGTITLFGATTENPSFSVNRALMSRCRVAILEPLSEEDLGTILERALTGSRGLGGRGLTLSEGARGVIVSSSDGDARRLLNLLELAAGERRSGELGEEAVRAALQRKVLAHDRAGEQHYDLISALHKSLRGSDPQAAIYWLARLIEGGEDPLYVARRMVRFASEDVGNSDPQALRGALDAVDAVRFVGMPEAELALVQAAVYLAAAPKSNSLWTAWDRARRDVTERPAYPVPLHIRNAPTALMREAGFAEGYVYDHDAPDQLAAAQTYLPPELSAAVYYEPKKIGFEAKIAERMEYWARLRKNAARLK